MECFGTNFGKKCHRYDASCVLICAQDIKHSHPDLPEATLKNRLCTILAENFVDYGKQYHDFPGLPEFNPVAAAGHINRLIAEETEYPEQELLHYTQLIPSLNNDQRRVFDRVTDAVRADAPLAANRVFFLDGPGGTGKTYLYNVILAKLRSEGKICLAVASSGIAAELLVGGRTAHSRFKIPLKVSGESTCNISLNTDLANLLKRTALIIWDEVPMSHKHVVETVDRTLRDITQVEQTFGGITTLFGGDFRQILPVILGGTRAQIVNATLKRSNIWRGIQRMSLQHNMRVQDGDEQYNNFLLEVGEGRTDRVLNLPQNFGVQDNTLEKLIDFVYPDLDAPLDGSVILATKNVDVDEINRIVQERVVGRDSRDYYSADSIGEHGVDAAIFPSEFLNSLVCFYF